MHPNAQTSLANLPHDIHSIIFSYFPRSALKPLRLTSNKLNSAIEPVLFHSVFLKININSFTRLLAIADHDRLSQHVQAFIYDPRTLHSEHISGRRLPRSFDDWVERFAGNGRELFQYYKNCGYGSRKDFIASRSTSELEGFYKRYCEYKADYDEIIKDPNKEKDMLAEIVPKFSNLKRILFFDPLEESDPIRRCDLKDLSWDDLSSVAKEILFDRDHTHLRIKTFGSGISWLQLLSSPGHLSSILCRHRVSVPIAGYSKYVLIRHIRKLSPSYQIWKIYLYNSPRRKEGHKEFRLSTSANSSPARRI
jgi:hypothetical protein